MTHTFTWNHEQSDGKVSFIQLPLKIVKTVDSGFGIHGTLICNDCGKKLSQKYRCECGKEYTIGEIQRRRDEDNDIIYQHKEKQEFMKTKVDEDINVMGEVSLVEIATNQEFLKESREIYSNENAKAVDTVKKIHRWLYKHQKGLVASFGLDGKNRAGVIVPGDGKLLLVEFRDGRCVRPPKQKDIEAIENDVRATFETLSEDKEPELYAEYIAKLKAGVKIEVKVEEKKTEEVKLEAASFLDE
jgi:hypothetical protein